MQTPEDDFYLGRYVLEHNLISREVLLECLYEIAEERGTGLRPGYAPPLGVLLVQRGLLTEEELNTILAACISPHAEGRSLSEAEVGKLLIASGVVTRPNIDECLRVQQEARTAGKVPPRLGELIVERGFATEQQVMRVLAYQKQMLFVCSGCGVRVTSVSPQPGSHYRCKKCGAELRALERRAASPRVTMREAEAGEDVQIEVDRAVAAFLKQKDVVRRDQIRDAQRKQMELARYGLVVPLLELMRRAGTITIEQQKLVEGVNFSQLIQNPEWKKEAVPGYRVQQRIASGGYATIYAAEPVFQGARVAVKILHPEHSKDDRVIGRFEAEAGLLRKFESPHIIRGIEYGSDRGYHYVVMEFVEGRSLGQSIAETGAIPLRNALAATRQVGEALRYMHAQGYLHRDVKPDNALIDAAGRVKLCDLGFAAEIEAARAAAPPDENPLFVDIYALGILLYALLTGHEPFEGASSEEPVTEQIQSGLPVPNLMVVNAPAAVIQFLKRIMHPDASKRFATMDETISALDVLLKD